MENNNTTNNLTEAVKKELDKSCELFDGLVNEAFEYVNSIFQLREYHSCVEYPVINDFAENLLKNTELHTAYTSHDHDEMRRIIAEEAYNYIKAFNCIETYLKPLNNNIARFCIQLLEHIALNGLHVEELKQEEAEQKGERH